MSERNVVGKEVLDVKIGIFGFFFCRFGDLNVTACSEINAVLKKE
jgi:hypothetical protein